MKTMTRREFMAGAAATAAGLCLASRGMAGEGGGGDDYEVAVLGDTHYDAEPESVYHAHYDDSARVPRIAKIQHEEFARNGEMWRERCPALVAASAALAAKNGARFVLQLGDLIQGDCDDVPTHQKMLADCAAKIRAPYPAGLPFLTVIGNHDFRGKGAREAYLDYAQPFMAREIAALTGEAEKPARYPAFAFRYGGDFWAFCDFETRDHVGAVCDLIESAGDARHVFLVTHGPFTASATSNSPRWRLAGAKECEAERPRLYQALSRRRAIVLSGHTHTTNFYRHENEWGGFTEATVNSVWSKPELATAEPLHSRPGDYAVAKDPPPADKDPEDHRREVAYFRPGLAEYFFNKGAGHYRLRVGAGRVALEFYPGAAREPARTFVLKGAGGQG